MVHNMKSQITSVGMACKYHTRIPQTKLWYHDEVTPTQTTDQKNN